MCKSYIVACSVGLGHQQRHSTQITTRDKDKARKRSLIPSPELLLTLALSAVQRKEIISRATTFVIALRIQFRGLPCVITCKCTCVPQPHADQAYFVHLFTE